MPPTSPRTSKSVLAVRISHEGSKGTKKRKGEHGVRGGRTEAVENRRQPKSSEEIAWLMKDGRAIDAAIRRAIRKAVAESKTAPRSVRPRKPRTPKTSKEIAEMIRTGKGVRATIRRAMKKAIGQVRARRKP